MNLIYRNAAVTYARSAVALVLGLFSSRWVLQALGATDFGLYAVVGALVALFGFLGGLLNVSVARHYAFALGEGGDEDALAGWFTAAFRIHLALAGLLVLVGWPVGEWTVRCVLKIPVDRVTTCLWVFRLSLFAAFMNMVAVPFGAMYTARQRFVKLALFGLGQTFVIFFGAVGLLHVTCDRLLVYAGYMTVAFSGFALAQIIGATVEFPSCRQWWGPLECFARPPTPESMRYEGVQDGHLNTQPTNRPTDQPTNSSNFSTRARAILSFAGWTLFGGGGYILGQNGGSFVTNLFFGPAANAAYGVSQQVQYHSEQLANAMTGAFEPAVTTSAGEGNEGEFRHLVRKSGLLAGGLFLLVAVPLFVLIDPVLKIWLGTPPEGTATVCRIMLAAMALNKLTMGQQLALNAKGRIAAWQVVSGCVLLLSVPLAAVLAWCGCGMTSVAWAWLAVYVGCSIANVCFARRLT